MGTRFGAGGVVLEVGGCVAAPAQLPRIRGRADVLGGDSPVAPDFVAPAREGFPLVVRPAPGSSAAGPADWAPIVRRLLDERLETVGAILLRGLPLPTVQHYSEFFTALGYAPVEYHGFATRDEVAPGVTTSNRSKHSQTVMLHNDMSNEPTMPGQLFLYCATPPEPGAGGESVIARGADWIPELGPELCARFRERAFARYTSSPCRSRGPGATRPWQERYGTDDPEQAAARCIGQGDVVEWASDGSLNTFRIIDAFREHRGETVWCCTPQSTWPASALEIRYGDGVPFEPETLQLLSGLQWKIGVTFEWQQGDVLCLDNLGCQHGRLPHAEDSRREIYVSIATPVRGLGRGPVTKDGEAATRGSG